MRKFYLPFLFLACGALGWGQASTTDINAGDQVSASRTTINSNFNSVKNVLNALIATLTTRGDIFTRGASSIQRLALGSAGQCLVSNGTDAVWGSCTVSSGGGGNAICADATGSGTTYTCAPSPALSACGAGTSLVFIPQATTTGAATLSATGCTSTRSIITTNGNGIVAGQLHAGYPYNIVYDGTSWVVQGLLWVNTDGTITIDYASFPPTISVTPGVFDTAVMVRATSSPQTSTYTGFYTNNSSGAMTFNLPTITSDKVGKLQFVFYNDVTRTGVITVQLPASTYMDKDGTNGTVASTIVSGGAAGDAIGVVAVSTTQYKAFPIKGTWTNN